MGFTGVSKYDYSINWNEDCDLEIVKLVQVS